MAEFKEMLMPAQFETVMKGYSINMIQSKHENDLPKVLEVKKDAIAAAVHVLKQYGYDAGADIFEKIMKN